MFQNSTWSSWIVKMFDECSKILWFSGLVSSEPSLNSEIKQLKGIINVFSIEPSGQATKTYKLFS